MSWMAPARAPFDRNNSHFAPFLAYLFHLDGQEFKLGETEPLDMLDLGHHRRALDVHSASRVSGIPTATQEMGNISLCSLPRLVCHFSFDSPFYMGSGCSSKMGAVDVGHNCPTVPSRPLSMLFI